MSGSRSKPAVGLATLIVLVGLCLLVFSGTAHNLLQPGGRTVRAVFANTQMLATGSPVRVDGVDVGTVAGTQLDPGGRTATIEMSITDPTVLPLYRNATATLKWRTVLGANYAIDITRGTPSSGVLAPQEISLGHTTGQVEIDQILSLLGIQERQGIRSMLGAFPAALSDKQAPADALNALSDASPNLTAGFSALEGEQPGDLHTLVSNTAQTVRSLDTPDQSLQQLVEGGAATLHTTAAHRPQIETTLTLSANTLPAVRTTLAELNTTLGIANPLIASLQRDAPSVAPAVTRLDPTVATANELLQSARPLLSSLRPAAHALKGLSIQGLPLLSALTPSLQETATKILPDLALVYKDSDRPTYEMLGPTIADLDAAAGALDSVGHFVTLTAGGGSNILDTLPCRTYLNDPDATQLATCENLTKYLGEILGATTPSQTVLGRQR
jgi:phospholipid/cholesterol/gamma-HCH transport system substrate-binding protein